MPPVLLDMCRCAVCTVYYSYVDVTVSAIILIRNHEIYFNVINTFSVTACQ